MRFERWALVMLLIAAAIAGWAANRSHPAPPPDGVSFTLPCLSAGASSLHYDAAQGPLFITLTAVGCRDCQLRLPVDANAYAMAHEQGVKTWKIFVYCSPERTPPTDDGHVADALLADPDGKTSVGLLGGSDQSCWIVLDRHAHVAWRGGPDMQKLKTVLAEVH